MEKIMEYLPILIPLVILELGLAAATIIHVVKHPKYRFGNKVFWIVMAFVQIIGPIIYFAFGKGEE